MSSAHEVLRILVIGESDVGKNWLILRFAENKFTETSMATIGVDFKTKFLMIDGISVQLQIWDTAGQERFGSVTTAYYRGAHGILFVFDISRYETFQQTKVLIDSILDSNPIDVILVGNKCGLEREVTRDEAEALAREFQISYFETSAKEAVSVEHAFVSLATMALRRRLQVGGKFTDNSQNPQVVVDDGTRRPSRKKCPC
jgi:Ras-related protein Rab-1A